MVITLEELLLSRDKRQAEQRRLRYQFSGNTLICMTVIMPGNVKRNRISLITAKAAVREIEKAFASHILYSQHKDLQTGYEFYLITDINCTEAKKMCCKIEETHPLGRLFDIDVFDGEGTPIQRDTVGFEKRKCLVCGNEARFCMRNRTHTQEEIHLHTQQLLDNYLKDNPFDDITDTDCQEI